ncbi:MAG: glutamine-hydrolyzing carbamoyl-phosphate synthase small subunit [Ignavibacteriales bacterium]|nr:glutamine-hydrolyzing carbamoyl-phosphate synthase small subunit [Ignavibacteriales bacterium]
MVEAKNIFSNKPQPKQATLVLEDGAEFPGWSFGKLRNTSGEVVFNTGMVGYPETLTDPSYRGQILVMTYPLIGNYGIPSDEKENILLKYFESESIHVRGLVVSEYSEQFSHWNASRSLSEWLTEHDIPGIYGIDTRKLTKKLREKGVMLGKIIVEKDNDPTFNNPNEDDLVSEVSTQSKIRYEKPGKRIAVVDCGVKNSIIQAFLKRNITVIRVPYDHDFLLEDVEGIVISNGPGDPKMCKTTIEHTRRALRSNLPILGICLGCQILALAAGADTYKLKYGHRGQNQPCNESGTKRCYITSQNHGYAVKAETLPQDWREWFINDNDGSNEGIVHISKPFFGAQFHPEASPGPDDTEFIFDMFIRALR